MERFTVFGDGEALQRTGERLRSERLHRNLPQGKVAQMAGVSRATIAKIETGDGRVALGTFARVLGVLGFVERLAEVVPQRPPPVDFKALLKPERQRARRRMSEKSC